MVIFWIMLVGVLITTAPFLILKRRPASTESLWMVRAAPLSWAVAALWELRAYHLGWNIRVDLLFIGAALIGVSFAALVAWLLASPQQTGGSPGDMSPNRVAGVVPTAEGLIYRQVNQAELLFPWSAVEEVRAFKLDRWLGERLCLGFSLRDGRDVVVDEDAAGFGRLLSGLPTAFPELNKNWQRETINSINREWVVWKNH